MKTLSYITTIFAGVCLLLALVAHFFFDGRIVFNWDKYISAATTLLLAAIVFILYHLVSLKNTK